MDNRQPQVFNPGRVAGWEVNQWISPAFNGLEVARSFFDLFKKWMSGFGDGWR
jgi:hypothetical protein